MCLQIFLYSLTKAFCIVSLFSSLCSYDLLFFRAGKRAKTLKDFVASSGSSSPVRERGGLSLSAVKSLVLGEKEDKLGFDSGDEEKLVSLVNSLFNVGRFALHGDKFSSSNYIPVTAIYFSTGFKFGKLFTDSNFLIRMIVSDLESPTARAPFAKDVHAAPPGSFVVKLAEVIGSFTTPRRMALFWGKVVDEVSYCVATLSLAFLLHISFFTYLV